MNAARWRLKAAQISSTASDTAIQGRFIEAAARPKSCRSRRLLFPLRISAMRTIRCLVPRRAL